MMKQTLDQVTRDTENGRNLAHSWKD
uniref:Uncharacterized protein n=1 Tax=Arundo donax TaxID=35708 RepID=A0A0A8YF40_ARUDO